MSRERPAGRAFDAQRLALFSRYGFDGRTRWIAGPGGRRTCVLVRGDGACPTVLIHGGLSQAGEWALLAGRLSGHVAIPDRPGCGLSDPIDYRGLDYRKEAVEWMRDLADGLGAGQMDLVGCSMGGYFSIAFALAHPERVRRLVLVGAPAGLDRPIPMLLRLWGSPVTGWLIGRMKVRDVEGLRRRIFAPLLVARPRQVPGDFLAMMLAGMALPGVDRSGSSMLRSVTTLRGFRPGLMLRDEMPRVAAPTLFLWGDADTFAPPASSLEVAARMRAGRVEVLRETGHLPQVDCPEEVAAAVGRFLAAPDVGIVRSA